MRLFVTDHDGKDLREHTAFSEPLKMVQGEYLRVDTEGVSPITFVTPHGVRTEKFPPFFVSGDGPGGKPLPWIPLTGRMEVSILTGAEHDLIKVQLDISSPPAVTPPLSEPSPKPDTGTNPPPVVVQPPVVSPPVVVTPPKPTLVRRVADRNLADRGDGHTFGKNGGSLHGYFIQGYEQNIVIHDGSIGNYDLKEIWTGESWRDGIVKHENNGQGLYIGAGNSHVTVDGFVAWLNGWDTTREAFEKNQFRHGVYANELGSLAMRRFLIDEPAASGIKSMRQTDLQDGFLHKCPIGLSTVYGSATVRNLVTYGGGRYHDRTNFTGNTICESWCPVTFVDCDFIGSEFDFVPPHPTARQFDMGAFRGSWYHTKYNPKNGYPSVPIASYKFENCRFARLKGNLFGGEVYVDQASMKPKVSSMPGLRECKVKRALDADVQALVLEARKAERPAAEYVKALQDLVRSNLVD